MKTPDSGDIYFQFYTFSSYTKNYRLGEIEADLVEVVMED
jgi:hypothetical protein